MNLIVSHIRQLARHNDIIGILTTDPLEKSLPIPDLYTITNGESRARINTADKHYRQQYEKSYDNYIAELRNEFLSIHTDISVVNGFPVTLEQAGQHSHGDPCFETHGPPIGDC